MRVYLNQFNGATTTGTLPLAAGVLAATVNAEPTLCSAVDIEICVDRLQPEQVVSQYQQPDVLGFSCYGWNLCYSLEVARLAKHAFPEALTVCGGPSIPRRIERVREFLDETPFVDVLVFGEGEKTFRELLAARLDGRDLATVPGLGLRTTCDPGSITVTEPRPRIDDFSNTPSPYLDGTFDHFLESHKTPIGMALCETNRGCPFSCTFCDWGQATGSAVVEMPLERVLGEFQWITNRGIPYIYIVDANFGIRPRDIALVQNLAECKKQKGFPAFCYFHFTKNPREEHLENAQVLIEAGIGCHLALSMQDFDSGVLKATRRSNISPENSLELRRICAQTGIPTLNELMLGLPEQTYDSFCRTAIQAITPYPQDSYYLYLCRLIENAEMATKSHRDRFALDTRKCVVIGSVREGSAIHVNERDEVIVATSTMPHTDWQRAYKFGQLLCVLHNMRLLRVVVLFLRHASDIDLKAWVEHLLAQMENAPERSVLFRLNAILDGYISSIRSNNRLVVQLDVMDDHEWVIEEALYITAFREPARFFEEARVATRAFFDSAQDKPNVALIDELFAFQQHITPSFERQKPEEQCFSRDWLTFVQSLENETGTELRQESNVLRYEPPLHVTGSARWFDFMLAQLTATHSKLEVTCVRRV